MRSVVFFGATALLASGCMSEVQKGERADAVRIEQAQASITNQLIDPTSPLFTDVKAGDQAVCGYVNGKNRFGAYAGKQRFLSVAGQPSELDPAKENVSSAPRSAEAIDACYFDVEFRDCMGEDVGDPIATCAPQLDNLLQPAAEPMDLPDPPEQRDAIQKCLAALDGAHEETFPPADLAIRSSQARQNPMSKSWVVIIDWAAGGTGSPLTIGTGRCNVVRDGTVWVNDLGAQ